MNDNNVAKQLPHDLLAEKSLLGCLLIDGLAFDEVSDLSLVGSDFYNSNYGHIFEAIKDLAISSQPIDYITVCSKLADKGQLELIGGQTSVLEIAEDQASAANVYHYSKIVKDKSNLRDIIRTSSLITQKGMTYQGSMEDYVSEVEAAFFSLTNKARTSGMVKLNLCLKENLKNLESSADEAGMSSGYAALDRLLLGMRAGQLIVLAARPAMGKTSLALNMALSVCEGSGQPIAIFSLEMTATDLSNRMLSGKAKVDSKRMQLKNFMPSDLKNIGTAIQSMSALPVFINDSGSVTVLDILSQCRKIKMEQGLGLIIIDYLQLMKSHTNNPSREQQISEISRALKMMAKELNCPVLALSQLNRAVESRPNKRPNNSDLRESGAIEQDADIVMFIYRDEVYNPESKDQGVAEVIVGKNRFGETGTARLAWVGDYTSFENLTEQKPYFEN